MKLSVAIVLILSRLGVAQRFEAIQTLGDTDEFFPRSDMGYAVDHSGTAWFFGGNTEDMTVSNELFTFVTNEAGAGTYTKIEASSGDLPSPRSSVALAVDSEYVFIFGGRGSNSQSSNDQAWLFTRSSNVWENISDGGPGPRYSVGAVSYQGTFVVIGGTDESSTALDEVWQFDPVARSWKEVPVTSGGSRMTARASPYVHAEGSIIYAVGGLGADGSLISTIETTTQIGSTLEQDWIETSPSPTPVQYGGAFNAVMNGAAFFLYGGSLEGGVAGCGIPDPLNPTDQSWFFDIQSSNWIETIFKGSKPPKLVRNAGVFISPYFYTMGGFEFECENSVGGPEPSTTTYRYGVVEPTLPPTLPPTTAPSQEPDDDILRDIRSGVQKNVFDTWMAGAGVFVAGLLL